MPKYSPKVDKASSEKIIANMGQLEYWDRFSFSIVKKDFVRGLHEISNSAWSF
jgi:hypothetical protein